MANKIIKLIVKENLAINQQIGFKIWKSDGTPVIFSNGQQQVSMVVKPFIIGGSINILIGTSKEQTAANIFYALSNYIYSGFNVSVDGLEITISIDNTDGFEHHITNINTPENLIVATDTPCDTVYIINDYQFDSYQGLITTTRDGDVGPSIQYPQNFDMEIDRDILYKFKFSNNPNYTKLYKASLTLSNVSLSQNNSTLTVNLNTTGLVTGGVSTYQYSLNGGSFSDSNILFGMVPNMLNSVDIIDNYGCILTIKFFVGDIEYGFINSPQKLTPVYNPIVFTFLLNNFNDVGFRYLITLKDIINNKIIGKFKIAPKIDGSGYIELSKILSNYTTVDFQEDSFSLQNCKNSYVNYEVILGMEYSYEWRYDTYSKQVGVGLSNTVLSSSLLLSSPIYQVGDMIQINDPIVMTIGGEIFQPINGLHTILEVYDYGILIDVPWFGYSGDGGVTKYSDNQKVEYLNIRTISNLYAFNGALSFYDYKYWDNKKYRLIDLDNDKSKKLLTSLPVSDSNKKYYATITQDFYINYFNDNVLKNYGLRVEDSYGNLSFKQLLTSGDPGNVKQFKINIEDLIINYGVNANSEWIIFHLTDSISLQKLTNNYKIYIDRRCKIEDVEIIYMDRMGSLLSQSFQLRMSKNIDIDKKTFNQNLEYIVGGELNLDRYDNLDLSKGGESISNINIKTTYELNTNWMSEENSLLFDELMTSPYKWIKLNDQYYSCDVKETSFKSDTQRNKKLIRKTINVMLNNEQIINV